MAARRCVLHGSFPTDMKFQLCPACGERTDYISNDEPDEHWASNIARFQEQIVKAEAAIPEVPVLEDARVVLEDGHYYISSHEVIRSGVQFRLPPQSLVQVGKQAFEVQSYSYKNRRYLVEPFSLELSDDALARLSNGE